MVRTRRMWVVSARRDDQVRGEYLMTEAGAQRWLGWTEENIAMIRPALDGPVRRLPNLLDVVRPDPEELFFIGIDRRSRRVASWISLRRHDPDRYEVGGGVGVDFRGNGYGGESLQAICWMAHRHFGIRHVTAGCEATNEASKGWLRGAGFLPTEGPATYVLPNGREIDSVWWIRSARLVRHACRWVPAT
jgi:RimJ/RimL family protein N-acetyltransferase